MSSNDMNNQGNLVADVMTDLTRNNPGHQFDNDGANNYPGGMGGMGAPIQQQPMQGGGGHPGQGGQGGNQGGQGGNQGGQGGQGGQPPVQINPELPKQFMLVLQQNPQMAASFQAPNALQQALQNPGVMMNAISHHQNMMQQMQAAQAAQASQASQAAQVMPPNANQMERMQQESQSEDDEDDDVNPDQAMNIQGPIQYEDDVPEVEQGKENSNKESPGFLTKLLNSLKAPIIATIFFVILSQPMVTNLLQRLIPRLATSSILSTIVLALIFYFMNFFVSLMINLIL